MVDYVNIVSDSISFTETRLGIFGVVRSASDTLTIIDIDSSILNNSELCLDSIFIFDDAAGFGAWSSINQPNQSWSNITTDPATWNQITSTPKTWITVSTG